MTETISVTTARQNLFGLLREVNADHTVKRITSAGGDAVLMSADDWDSWQETAYLMRAPANHQMLLDAMEDDRHDRNMITPTPEQWAALEATAEDAG